MMFAVLLVILSLGIVGLLSAAAYLVFFHGQITRPKIEELFGIAIKTKDSVLISEPIGRDVFLVGSEYGFRGGAIMFFSSNDRFELGIQSAQTLSEFFEQPVYFCNHYGYPTKSRFAFVPRTTFSRLKLNGEQCAGLVIDDWNERRNEPMVSGLNGDNLLTIGQSLGALVAAHVASKVTEVDRLILVSPFTDSDEILANALPRGLKWLVRAALFRPSANIHGSLGSFSGGIHVMIPAEDTLVPVRTQEDLVHRLGLPAKNITLMQGKTHFGLMGDQEFMLLLRRAADSLSEQGDLG